MLIKSQINVEVTSKYFDVLVGKEARNPRIKRMAARKTMSQYSNTPKNFRAEHDTNVRPQIRTPAGNPICVICEICGSAYMPRQPFPTTTLEPLPRFIRPYSGF
jgi:formate hydrogenlyase subunit 6/NADH:ubiquinone oxidoreductase subunit I